MESTTPKRKNNRLIEVLLLVFALICFALVVADVSSNLAAEINGIARTAIITQGEAGVTAVPTLTEEQYQELLGPEGSGSR